MSFNILHNTLGKRKATSRTTFWSALSYLQNDANAANLASKRLKNTIRKDVAVREAVAVLKQARNNFRTYGATEAAMSIFNQGSQLSQSLGIAIPKVTSVNAANVGKACCNKINSKINETVKFAKHYGNTIVAHSANLINKANKLADSQKYILEMLYNRISNDIKVVNAKQLGRTYISGYTRPIFMMRIDALNEIASNLHRFSNLTQCRKSLGKQFHTLGWSITDEGEIVETPEEEVAETAPDEDEVMNPVTDPDTDEPIEDDDAEETELVEVPEEAEIEEEDPPASAPQEQPMAVFGWNPTTMRQATGALHKLTTNVKQFSNTYKNLIASKRKISSSVESYRTSAEKNPILNNIDNYRRFNTFVASVIGAYTQASNEMLNQIIAMYGALKDAEVFPASSQAVSVKSITAQTPWGLRKAKGGFFNTDELPEGDAEGEEDASGTALPGELEDDTEGPTKATEPDEEAATDLYYNAKKKKSTKKKNELFVYDEDELPEGDAEGEEDASGTELPGELEDDTEGPTKATEPIEDFWSSAINYFDEDDDASDDKDDESDDEEDEDSDDDTKSDDDEESKDDDSDDDKDDDSETTDAKKRKAKKKKKSTKNFWFDEDELPEGDAEGEEDASGTALPGELEDDTEGPTKATDPMDWFFNADDSDDDSDDESDDTDDDEDLSEGDKSDDDDSDDKESDDDDDAGDDLEEEKTVPSAESYIFFDEDELPEGDAEGETDDSDTELPGELEDDTEGPTTATEPDEDGDGSDDDDTGLPDSDDQGDVDDPANEEATTTDWYSSYFNEDESEEESDDEESDDEESDDEESDDETSDPDEEAGLDTEPKEPSYVADPDDAQGDDDPTDFWFNADTSEEEDADEGDKKNDEEEKKEEEEEKESESEEDDDESDDEDEDEKLEEGDEPADDSETTDAKKRKAKKKKATKKKKKSTKNFWFDEDESDDDETSEEDDEESDDDTTSDDESDDTEESDDQDADDELDDDDSPMMDFGYFDDDIVGPETPDEYPTEPTETPDGVDPNGDVEIPDAQTEPYMQPESTPPEDIPDTSINDYYFE